jgi:beta-lactamase class A
MTYSRRDFLRLGLSRVTAATALGALQPAVVQGADPGQHGLAERIVTAFRRLPGTKALKLWAPAAAGDAEWVATLNPGAPLFCGSSFKVYVLAEFLRQVENSLDPHDKVPLATQLQAQLAQELVLDERVWSPSAPVFNPPNLSGKVTARTVLEAMISHSDNTATDMALRHVGAERVRDFIASIGLRDTRIPTSTRQFFGYILGYPGWRTITWTKVIELLEHDPYQPRPIINNQITMVGSPHDFVSFYSRALQGRFFKYPETLEIFRAILSLADAIALTVPLGVNAFMKAGSIDTGSQFALCLAGGLWIPKRWVYFTMIVNWTDAEGGSFAEEAPRIARTAKRIFTWVRDGLGRC